MRRIAMIATLLCAPLTMSAQSHVLANPTDFEGFLSLSYRAFGIQGEYIIRNTFAYDPNRAFAITKIVLTDPTGIARFGTPNISNPGTYSNPLPGVAGGQAFNRTPNYFTFDNGTTSSAVYGNPIEGSLANGLGLLGCSVPIIPPSTPVAGFFALTCPSSGYNGSIALNFRFDYPTEMVPVVANRFSVQVYGVYLNGPTYFVTPEPSTYALMAAGLATLGVLARRRRAV